MSLIAFIVTAVVASRLWATSRAKEQEARRQREQVLKLYKLSCAIIINLNPADLLASIAHEVLETFGYRHCGIFQQDENGVVRCASVARAGGARDSFAPESQLVETVFRTGIPRFAGTATAGRNRRRPPGVKVPERAATEDVTAYIPAQVGSRVVSVLVLVSDLAETETLGAIASLVALALERARLLNEIQLKESLKQSDKLKSALLASVSHNLRTPLTSIRASVESILTADAGEDNPLLRELHLIISEEVNRLSRIVDHLLEMARVEAGELRPKREWISVSELLENVLQSCAAAVRRHKLLVHCAETIPLINVDPRMIAEVLTNLIENAAKYSPIGSAIDIGAGSDGDTLCISVADQGPGIPSAETERIFDKFYRGTQPNPQMQDGTGMGLAIARGFVEAHSGKIWVECVPGSGAKFKFTVPIDSAGPREIVSGMIKS